MIIQNKRLNLTGYYCNYKFNATNNLVSKYVKKKKYKKNRKHHNNGQWLHNLVTQKNRLKQTT